MLTYVFTLEWTLNCRIRKELYVPSRTARRSSMRDQYQLNTLHHALSGVLTARGERRERRGEWRIAANRAASGESPLGHLLRKKYVIVRSRPLSTLTAFPSVAALSAALCALLNTKMHVVDFRRGAARRG